MRFSKIISTLFLIFLPKLLIADFLDDLGPAAKLAFGLYAESTIWSPDGKYLAIGGSNGTTDVIVYGWDSSISSTVDLGAGAKLNFGYAYSVNWSPNGKYLAIGGSSGTTDVAVYEWNSLTNSFVDLGAGAKLNFEYAYSVNWSPNGKYLAIGGSNGTTDVAVYEWDSSTNSFVDLGASAKLDFGSRAYSTNWSPDGKYLAIGGSNGTTDVAVYEWNSLTNSFVDLGAGAKLDFGHHANSVNWSPNGKYLAIGGWTDTTNIAVYEWNNLTNNLIDLGAGAKLDFGSRAYSTNWSPDGKYLAIGGYSGVTANVAVYEWNSLTNNFVDLGAGAKLDFENETYSVNWSPDGKYLAIGGYSGVTANVAVYLTYEEYLRNLISQLEEANGSIFDNPLTSDLTLQNDFHIAPGQKIEIANTLTIDGQGATVEFSDPNHAQFIVRPGCIVTLKNIELDRINSKTFDLRWVSFKDATSRKWSILEGQINIGENVIFTLSEDVTFSQGLINLTRQTDGDPSIFYFKDFVGKNKLILNPTDKYKQAIERASKDGTITNRLNQFDSTILIQLNENTLALQGIDLYGVDHVSNTINNYVGAIGLIGETNVNFGNSDFTLSLEDQKMGLKETYNMVFVVEGINNSFILHKDDLLFTGELMFVNEGENSLDITTLLQEKIVNPADDANRRIPLVNFGTGFMYLTSSAGKATVNFTDQQIRINNSQNGFIAEENSVLKGNRIEVYGDHIWDLSDPYTPDISFVSMVAELLAPDATLGNAPILPSVIFTSPEMPNHFSGLINRHKTALHLKYQKGHELLTKTVDQAKVAQLPNPSRKVLSFFNIRNQELAGIKGNVELDGSNATKFSISDEDINLTIKNGSTVTLGSDDFVVLKPRDIINIIGTGNEIRIQKNLYVQGQILFAPNSELKIVFLNPDAGIIFANNNHLILEQNTKLTFDGPGFAEFEDDCSIFLKGQKNVFYTNPELIINNQAVFFPAKDSTVQITGIGNISIHEGGTLGAESSQHIIIGNSTSDEIGISVIGGMLQVSGDINGTGIISLQKGTFSLSASLNGIISIEDKGILEINTLNNVLSKGNFMEMLLDPHGQFALNNGGKLSFAANLNEPEILGQDYITWKSINTVFSSAMTNNNAGLVAYVSGTPAQGQFNRSFAGRLQLANAILNTESTDGTTAEQLVRTLINQLNPTTFPTATLFTDASNKQFIRLKNGALIEVVQGDVFKSEATDGSVLAKNNNNNVTYKLNGTRQVSIS